MDVETYGIESIRNKIASIMYNDCLPTNLVTNSLRDICFHYENYEKTMDQNVKEQELEAIRASVNMINLQNIYSGGTNQVLEIQNASNNTIQKIGAAISTIYAIPYHANTSIDYVGYAYGFAMNHMENKEKYQKYEPYQFLNKCSTAIKNHGDNAAAESIIKTMANCAGAVSYLKCVESGEMNGNIYGLKNLVKQKLQAIASEVEALTGEHIDIKNNGPEVLYIASCINASITFGNKEHIEKFRENGLFKDNRAYTMTEIEF